MILILTTALICGLIQLVLHWFPWRMLMGRDPYRSLAQSLGVLGIVLPLSVLYSNWEVSTSLHLIALWACVLASELAMLGAHGLDWVIERVRRSYEHEELNNAKAGREQ